MTILHICHDYSSAKIYEQLFSRMDRANLNQIIYAPVRKKELIGKNRNNKLKNTRYYYSYILNILTKLNYFHKIDKIYKDILIKIKPCEIDITHAHFLFSDGGVALKLKEKYNIDFITAVRNTDINIFFKYLIHLRKKGIKILENASKIILLSPCFKNRLLKFFPKDKVRKISSKIEIIPNGIDTFWLKNKFYKKKVILKKNINLIYVGNFSYNKNIHTSIRAVKILRSKGYDVNFTIIGYEDHGMYARSILKIAGKNSDFLRVHEKINNKKKLLRMYRTSDIFVMPSFHETFGLVYIEAMSQGLPIIYTKGQGVDGFFEEGEVGFPADPYRANEIADLIITVTKNYRKMSKNCLRCAGNFNWKDQLRKYINIYHRLHGLSAESH